MKEVMVYVEGPSDKLAMEELLRPLLQLKAQQGTTIQFFETPDGDRKASVLTKVPVRAVNILRNKANSIVVALPDLYPKNKGFPHTTEAELREGLQKNFEKALQKKGLALTTELTNRFKVFCFKHDLEALLLASEEALQSRLGLQSLKIAWTRPVEDQNHNKPPKYVIEELFKSRGEAYRDTLDAPLILGVVNYSDLKESCSQCFKPFVEFLEEL